MNPQGMSIQQVYRLFRENKLLVNRKYQRKLVWTEEEKVQLIDTVRQGFPMPLFLFAERQHVHGSGVYEILDGVQRLNAIFSFVENVYPIDNKYFDVTQFATARQVEADGKFKMADATAPKITPKECAQILDYQLAVTIYPALTDAQIIDVFGRINSGGRQLSNQEKRQAGIVDNFGGLVKTLASEIRGDITKEVLLLHEMPDISIDTPRIKQGYSIKAEDTFWCKNGILWSTDIRASEDEEIVADILASILLKSPLARSREALDALYRDPKQRAALDAALVAYPQNKLADEFKQIISVMESLLDAEKISLKDVLAPKGTNPVKASFYATFMAFYDLMVTKKKSPVDAKKILAALNNLQSKMTRGFHYVKVEERIRDINMTVGLIQSHFVEKEPPSLTHGIGLAIDFENSLRRSKIETPRYEFKQGFLRLDSSRQYDGSVIEKIVNTICGMANSGPESEGFIYIGVGDKKADAEQSRALYGDDFVEFANHYVLGVDREIRHMGIKPEEYFRKVIDGIRNSHLCATLKTQVLAQVDMVEYKGKSVIRLRVPPQKEMSFVGGNAFVREGNETKQISGPQIVAVSKLFERKSG